MTVVLKARSQTTQELGRNANYLAPLRPTDSEALRVGPRMFKPAIREGETLGVVLHHLPVTARESLLLSSGNQCKVNASCTHLSNNTEKHKSSGCKVPC